MKARILIAAALATVAAASLAAYALAAGRADRQGQAQKAAQAFSATMTVTASKQGQLAPIAITGYSHAIVSPRDASSGLPTGKRQHKPITIVKEWGASTPLLMQALVQNENLKQVVITVVQGNTAVARVALTNASVSDYSVADGAESWSFTYQKISWTWVDGGITASDDWEAPAA